MEIRRACIALLLAITCLGAQGIPTPTKFFGFEPGADRELFTYEQLIDYLERVDEASDRLDIREIGRSPEGRIMYVCLISAAENLARLDELRNINQQLTWNVELDAATLARFQEEGRVFVLGTLSMHSDEVGPSQAAPLIAYEAATTNDPELIAILSETVYMMVPCHNPDGMDMVVNNYHKYKGTEYEGADLPGVYHKYVGHDNNRDFVTLTQTDTKAISSIVSHDWMPQVLVEKHQMGYTSPRYFVPPMHDPIAENVDAEVFNWTWVFGSAMVRDMTNQGLKGVSQHAIFDDYWPGSTETPIWKGVISLLTEAASARLATPLYVEPTELVGRGKGLSEYKKSINMLDPWPGGWWRLSDIVDYEIASTWSILRTAAEQREKILAFRNEVSRRAVEQGRSEAPVYFILPVSQQHDVGELAGIVDLLHEHGVQVHRLTEDLIVDGCTMQAGDVVVSLAQPYRAFIKEVLEAQRYPERHYTPGGKLIEPYDITSWSLPLHRGVTAWEIERLHPEVEAVWELVSPEESFALWDGNPPGSWTAVLLDGRRNESFDLVFRAVKAGLVVHRLTEALIVDGVEYPAGSFIMPRNSRQEKMQQILLDALAAPPLFFTSSEPKYNSYQVKMPRIALVESWFHDMDAGWTRFVLDSYGVLFTVLRPDDIAEGNLSKKFDVILMPDVSEAVLEKGRWKMRDGTYAISDYPPEYTKGMEKEGKEALVAFVNGGGRIVSWGRSGRVFLGTLSLDETEFILPIDDRAEDLQKQGLSCPGSLVRIILDPDHPLTQGLPDELGVFYRARPVYQTRIPDLGTDRRVVAWFPERDLLLSGYADKAELLGGKAALVWTEKGKGEIIFMAFGPQFRASTSASYKLLWNSLLIP
jgi:hypothetical protein